MLKQDFINSLENMVKSVDAFKNDKPAIRMLFNDAKDSLFKDSVITDAQCSRWVLTDRELSKLLKAASL